MEIMDVLVKALSCLIITFSNFTNLLSGIQ